MKLSHCLGDNVLCSGQHVSRAAVSCLHSVISARYRFTHVIVMEPASDGITVSANQVTFSRPWKFTKIYS